MAEHFIGNEEVGGPTPLNSFKIKALKDFVTEVFQCLFVLDYKIQTAYVGGAPDLTGLILIYSIVTNLYEITVACTPIDVVL